MKKRTSRNHEFEEVIVRCSVCGKKMKMVKYKEVSPEGWICQKCGKGEVEVGE